MFDYFFQKAGSTWNQWEDLIERGNTVPANARVSISVLIKYISLNYVFVIQ